VTIDTLRADHLSVYGYPVDTTPRLAEFAKTATVYTACGAQAPSTWQSVPSLLSGLTPYRHGGVSETRRLSDDLTLLPEILQKQGYETIGESANPWVSARYGMTQGFDEFHLYNTDDELMLYDFMKLAMRLDPWDVFRLRDWLPSYAYVPFGTLVDDAVDCRCGDGEHAATRSEDGHADDPSLRIDETTALSGRAEHQIHADEVVDSAAAKTVPGSSYGGDDAEAGVDDGGGAAEDGDLFDVAGRRLTLADGDHALDGDGADDGADEGGCRQRQPGADTHVGRRRPRARRIRRGQPQGRRPGLPCR